MIAVDTNILIYAHRTDSAFHATAATRIRGLAEGSAPWAIPWPCVHEFLAIVTNRRVYQPPATASQAVGFIAALIASPALALLAETESHWAVLRDLVDVGDVRGGRVHDARIAAICLEHGVTALWTADRDFARFRRLSVVNPLAD